jgi:hypothetical protein
MPMQRLERMVGVLAGRWWWVVLVTVANLASFNVLFSLEARFEGLTGRPVYDTQNDLTVERVLAERPLYQGEALSAYYAFAAYDYLFPLVGGLFLAVWVMVLLRANTFAVAQRLLAWRLPLGMFIATLCDWGENLGLLVMLNTSGVGAGDAPSLLLVQVVLLFKQLKLATLLLSFGVLLFVLALWGSNVVYRLWQARRAPSA